MINLTENPAKLELTDRVILADIQGFKNRIWIAKQKLAKLKESSPYDWKGRRKLKAKRGELDGEIIHVQNLISIARSALKGDSVVSI